MGCGHSLIAKIPHRGICPRAGKFDISQTAFLQLMTVIILSFPYAQVWVWSSAVPANVHQPPSASFIGAYKEDCKIHIFTRYNKELSKEFAENALGVEYKGESYITEAVFDEKTYDYLEFIITKELNGVSELIGRNVYEYDLPEPAACTALRCAFESKTENMVNVTFVLEPGTKNEIRKTFKVSVDTDVTYSIEDPENYEAFSDSKCEKPFTGQWDKMSDLSVYFKRINTSK